MGTSNPTRGRRGKTGGEFHQRRDCSDSFAGLGAAKVHFSLDLMRRPSVLCTRSDAFAASRA